MSRLPGYQALAQGLLNDFGDLLYRHTATWSDGAVYTFSLQDPNKVDTPLTRSLRQRPDAPDVRVLRLPPGSPRPPEGSSLPWQGGVVFVERYAQTSDFTDTNPGICVWIDPARTRADLLVFQTAGPLVTDPRTLNTRPGPGVPLAIPARLEATSDPKARLAVGADQAEAVLFGRWGGAGTPQAKPAAVHWGSICPLTLQGQPGVLTVRLAWPDADPIHSQIHGEPFLAVWTAK